MENLLAELEATARRIPASLAMISHGGHIRYGELLGKITSSVIAARQRRIEPGQFVAIACRNPAVRLIVCLALMRIGCRIGYAHGLSAYAAAGVAIDAVIADQGQPDLPPNARVVTVGPDWFRSSDGLAPPLPQSSAEFSVVVASSGSTGTPKLIEIDRDGLRYRLSPTLLGSFRNGLARYLSVAGDSTLPTLQDDIATLIMGGLIVRSPTRVGGVILDTIQAFRPDYCVMAPIVLNDVLNALEKMPRVIDKVALLRLTGAYCPPPMRRAALERIAEQLVITYGATEIGRVAWGYAADVEQIAGSVGRIVDGVEVAAFDEAGAPLPPGSEGEIRVRIPDPALTTYPGTDSPQPRTFVDGWFLTGDIGLVDAHRNLIIRGRNSNVVNVGGTKISAEALESALSGHNDIGDIGVTGADGADGIQRIAAAVVSRAKLGIDDVNAYLRGRQGLAPVHILKIVPAIPRTDSGKIDRAALKRLFADGA